MFVCLFFSGLLLLQRPVWISWEAKPNRSEAWLIWNRRCCDKKTKTLRCFTLWFASVNCSGCDRWPMIESCLLLFLFSSFLVLKTFSLIDHAFFLRSSLCLSAKSSPTWVNRQVGHLRFSILQLFPNTCLVNVLPWCVEYFVTGVRLVSGWWGNSCPDFLIPRIRMRRGVWAGNIELGIHRHVPTESEVPVAFF